MIGFAVVGIYTFLLAFLYFSFYQTKKRFAAQFKTPYYLQNLEFSETDLLDFRIEFTDELLAQFGYECLRNDAKFGVLEQNETNVLKQCIKIKRSEADFPKLNEPKQVRVEPNKKATTDFGSKYLENYRSI